MGEEQYVMKQRKYCVTSICCGLVILLITVLSLVLVPIVNNLIVDKFDVLPSMLYKLITPFVFYITLGILILSFVSMFVDIRLKPVWRICVIAVGCLMLLIYLLLAITPFVEDYPFRQELLPLIKVLNLRYFEVTQRVTSLVLGASVFAGLNR